jgi:hypothetical protein
MLPAVPTYFMSPYSPATWEAAAEHLDNRQTAFARSQFKTAKNNVSIGDVFLCYIIGATEMVAALRAVSAPYLVEGGQIRQLLLYPVRFDTEVVARVPVGDGVRLAKIKSESGDPTMWISLVQGALKRVPEGDAKWIVSQLRDRSNAAS